MIKISREIESEKIKKAKDVLAEEKSKRKGNYNKEEVLDALKLVFNNKCYICENKKVTSYNIEHYKPHRNIDKNLKFKWENLFLACAHCNNIKLGGYENILDCTEIDIDEVISFRKIGNFSWNEYIKIEPLNDSEDVKETVDLLNKVYIGSTAMKKLEATNIRKELRSELQKFINAINEYDEAEGMDKEDAALLIVRELKCNSPFAAFKRWVIRDNCDKLSKFMCKW